MWSVLFAAENQGALIHINSLENYNKVSCSSGEQYTGGALRAIRYSETVN
jgi:hypothetical protein